VNFLPLASSAGVYSSSGGLLLSLICLGFTGVSARICARKDELFPVCDARSC
jgi:hypothetical protein